VEESRPHAVPTPAPPSEVPYHELWIKPFRENTDPSFLWLGPQYRDAFATLRAAILQNAGVLLLTGDVGTGKTMLARALGDSLRAEGVRVGRLAYAGLHPQEFWNAVSLALELPGVTDTRAGVPAHVAAFLHQAYARRAKVLLVIDEAQDLVPAVLDEIDQLARAGLEAGRGKVNVVNILLVGQPAIDGAVGRRAGRDGQDRVAVRLSPLPPEQVAEYIAFRLRVSGADRELFSADVIAAIATAAAGVPRLVNRICDCALQVASQRDESVVSLEIVAETLSDFGLTTSADVSARAGHRRAPRGAFRRIAYAAALTLVVGLGVAVYQGGGATHVREDHPSQPVETAAPEAPGGSPSVVETLPSPPTGSPLAADPQDGEVRPGVVREQEGAAKPRPETRPLALQPAMNRPRPDTTRVPRTALPETRIDRVRPEPASLAAPAGRPERIEIPPATADRGAPAAATAATHSRRPVAGGSDESDDPAAIINWLLQGQRGAER
jgi:general secretion pathway protein A